MFSTVLLVASFSTSLIPAPPAAPAGVSPDHVRALVRQLDDDQFNRRQEADRALRQFGAAAVPLLRQEMEGSVPLEARRRLATIVNDLTQVHWQRDLHGALAEALRTKKPLLVFSTAGLPGSPSSLESAAMQQRTFTDLELVTFLNAHYVVVWHDPLPGEVSMMGVQARALRRVTAAAAFTPAQVAECKEGQGTETNMFLCAADGTVVQHLVGFHGPARLREAARAVQENPRPATPAPRPQVGAAASQVPVPADVANVRKQQQVDAQVLYQLQVENAKLANAVGRHVWDAVVDLERLMRVSLRIGC